MDAQIKTPGGKTYDVIFVGTGEFPLSFFLDVNALLLNFCTRELFKMV